MLSKKWLYFIIGCVCFLVLVMMKSWLSVIAVFCLIDLYPAKFKENHAKTKQIQKTQRLCLITLMLLPVTSLALNLAGDRISQHNKYKKEQEALIVAQQEEERIANALVWDIETDPSLTDHEKEFIKKAANNAIQNEKQCIKLRMGGQSTIDPKQYYIECVRLDDTKFKLYFTEEKVTEGSPIKIEEPYEDADLICLQAISKAAKFPATVNYEDLINRRAFSDGDTEIIQEFTSQNSYGMTIRNRATCLVSKDGNLREFEIE